MEPEPLTKDFTSRDELIGHVAALTPWLADRCPSPIRGGTAAAKQRLKQIDPVNYGATRNFLDGQVTRLSPYIRHGIVSLDQVRRAALASAPKADRLEKFLQQLAWRDYWQRLYYQHPEWLWRDVEAYKTGFFAADYDPKLPSDIAQGRTGVACIDAFIHELGTTGYLHNHARLYVAAYVVHWRRIRWQTGARWFLHHLIDGDPASNNLSWQWVASTFSNRPYIFNLDNVKKFAPESVNTSSADNQVLDADYETLMSTLFPRLVLTDG